MLTLTHVGLVGEAHKYALTDDGYKDEFIVSNTEIKVDPQNAVRDAIKRAVAKYRAKVSNG